MTFKTALRARPEAFLLVLLALFLVSSSGLLGQTYQQVAPKSPEQDRQPVAVAPAAPATAPVADPNEVLVPILRGVRLVPSVERVSKTPISVGEPLVIVDLPWLRQGSADSAANEFVGHPLTRGDLVRLVRELVLLCRASDRSVVDVFAPPQDVSSGVVQVVVMVARFGQVTVEGNRFFSSPVMLRQMRVAQGTEITESSLMGDMDRLNQNPFRQVDLVYSRGAEAGMTDIVLRVRDIRPERVYAGYEDSGNAVTGLGRVMAGFNLGNLWDEDHQVNYQYTRSTDSDRLQAHSGSYTVLLPWRNIISVYGDWSQAILQPGELFALDGVSWQVGLRYTVPLPNMRVYEQSLVFGADYKWSNNNLAFGGVQVFNSPENIAEGSIAYTGSRTDLHGTTQGSVTLFVSPGGVGGLNHDHDFAVQRPGAKADYEYVQASFARIERLPNKYTLMLTTLSQWSSGRLLPSEQFGLGGGASVRGYDERLANGDDGVSGQLELRTPNLHLLGKIPDKTQFLVFVDGGRDWQHNRIPGEFDYTFASAGPGIRLNIGTHGTIKADYGFELQRISGTRSGRPHLSAILSF